MKKQKMFWKVRCDMGKLVKRDTNEVILEDAQIADSFISRFMGLMGKKDLPEATGLIIEPCNSVHCFFMRFPIDVIFVDSDDRVVHIIPAMKPGRISPIVRKAKYVIESNAHTLSEKLWIGDTIFVKK